MDLNKLRILIDSHFDKLNNIIIISKEESKYTAEQEKKKSKPKYTAEQEKKKSKAQQETEPKAKEEEKKESKAQQETESKEEIKAKEVEKKCNELISYEPNITNVKDCNKKTRLNIMRNIHPDKNPECIAPATKATNKFDKYWDKKCGMKELSPTEK